MPSPNARTRAYYERLGCMAAIVEVHSPFPKPFGKKHDMHGIFDLFVLKRGGEAWGIQATSTPNMSARVHKLYASERYAEWIELGGKAAVVGWSKTGERGKRKLWTIKILELGAPPVDPRIKPDGMPEPQA